MTRFLLGAATVGACWALVEWFKNPMGHRGGMLVTTGRKMGDDRHGPNTITLPNHHPLDPSIPRPRFLP